MSLTRLDKFLSNRDDISRERAALLIKEGRVSLNGSIAKKLSMLVSDKDIIKIEENIHYVGRGYLKLERALDAFNVEVKNKNVLDVGSSTGGFTQLLLEREAKNVTAIDVGKDQMAKSLRESSKITLYEGCNVKNFVGIFDLVVVDLSFISLASIANKLSTFIDNSNYGKIICLIKPQFELGSRVIGKKGVVKDKSMIDKAVKDVISAFEDSNIFLNGLIPSPIKGKKGNIEMLALFSRNKI